MARAFYIDSDVALGAHRGDVDDGFAIAALLCAPDVELLGISSVFGNTDSATAAHCARRLVSFAAHGSLVIEGAARAGQVSAAAEVIAALPDRATVLALGPLTNVAAALALDPSLARRVTIHVVGGRLDFVGALATLWPFEFNLAKDPSAARMVMDSGAVQLYPLEVCAQLRIGMRQLISLGEHGALGRLLQRDSLRWLAYAPLRYQRLSFPLWDLVPALVALDLLPHQRTPLRLRVAGAGRLRIDAGAAESRVVRAITPALDPLFALLARHPVPDSAR